jgi:transposase InsO family protein
MPFGLRNAAQTFQQLMDRVFRHQPFCFCYLDDHLIASRTLDEHLQHLRTYFQLFQDNGLQINPAKCVFAVAEVDFLGHRVSAAGISPLPKHVEALQRLPVPTDVKGLQRFLGLINFYSRFLPGIAATRLPLTDALRGLPQHLTVTAEMTAAALAVFAAAQRTCPEVGLMRQSPSLDIFCRLVGTEYLFGDVSTPLFRPLVPLPFRRDIFDGLHNAGHPGVRATRRLISSHFVWPCMAQQVNEWARQCVACQRAKTTVHPQPPPATIPVPAHRFSHVNIDLVGPLPMSGGYTHLLTIIDRSSRWPEAVPVSSTTAASCASAFFHHWVSRFGVPAVITSDHGVQFTSSLWSSMCQLFTICHLQMPAYHPQANGAIEKFHRRLKDALRACGAATDWYHHLPWVLLAIRTASRDEESPSPAELLYGAQLVVPGQFVAASEDPPPSDGFLQQLRSFVDASAPLPVLHNRPSTATARDSIPTALLHARHVFVSRDAAKLPLAPAYDGPYLVLERSPYTFRLQLDDKNDVIATARLKVAVLPLDAPTAELRRRGRPARGLAVLPAAPSVPARSAIRRACDLRHRRRCCS